MASLQNHLCTLYRRILRCLFALTAAWLFVGCLVTTNYVTFYPPKLPETSWLCPDNTGLQCLLFSLVCLGCLCRKKVRNNLPRSAEHRRLRRLRRRLILLGGMMAFFWMICVQGVPNSDSSNVQDAALRLSKGDFSAFMPGAYLYVFPHQNGLLLFHLLLQHLNPNTTLPFQMFNVLCYTGILFFLGELATELGSGDEGCLAAALGGILFLPLLFYIEFVYGTIPGLFFSLGAIVLSLRFSRHAKWHQAVLASLCTFLAVLFKSNYQIFTIGLILYAFYCALQKRKHCWLLLPLLFVGWLLALKLPLLLVERMIGFPLRNGFASISWVAMGLRDVGTHGPGWYDGFTDYAYYTVGNMDSKLQSAVAIEEIKRRIQEFISDPGYALSFFTRKNATQWTDPLFQSLWLNLSMREVVPGWTKTLLDNQGPTVLKWFMNLLQTLTYGGLVLWAWVPTREKRKPAEDLLAVILLGGFVFHTFWEAKSQYILPYVVLVLPLALLGYRRLALLSSDSDVKNLWNSFSCKVRFQMPVLLMLLAMILSVLLAAPLRENLAGFLGQIS